ncbi:hypothetical protein BDV96DRAFT_605881 [Lophiotrema nucula]|uniref:Uncharacterized protein n=1 Tax=Lophiotrema nucula TaxID=690887 RepID=A0A6A5YMK9_9PLEO|nr:hypothetical protein BDV96DRAFT_605881 [Lophiotrema nucula]
MSMNNNNTQVTRPARAGACPGTGSTQGPSPSAETSENNNTSIATTTNVNGNTFSSMSTDAGRTPRDGREGGGRALECCEKSRTGNKIGLELFPLTRSRKDQRELSESVDRAALDICVVIDRGALASTQRGCMNMSLATSECLLAGILTRGTPKLPYSEERKLRDLYELVVGCPRPSQGDRGLRPIPPYHTSDTRGRRSRQSSASVSSSEVC